MSYTLPTLTYQFTELEPIIDAQTVELHYSKHHQTYTDKLNAALQNAPDWQNKPVEELLKHLRELPADLQTAVRNHGGGYYNHNLYWAQMIPAGKDHPELIAKLAQQFLGFEKFQEVFSNQAAALFGSGWTWLVSHDSGEFSIMNTSDQDNPLTEDPSLKLLLALDVWEHAYYLKYQNRRVEYINNYWQIINWEEVNRRLEL